MSFFSYQPPPGAERPQPDAPTQPEMKVPPHMVIIDGTNLVKVVADNPEIPEGKTDVGNGEFRHWQALNYNPATGGMI